MRNSGSGPACAICSNRIVSVTAAFSPGESMLGKSDRKVRKLREKTNYYTSPYLTPMSPMFNPTHCECDNEGGKPHHSFWILDFSPRGRLSDTTHRIVVRNIVVMSYSSNPKSKIENYLITLSARANTFGGIVRPICLAAFKLIINSNLIGCSTGKSAGVLPFKILST